MPITKKNRAGNEYKGYEIDRKLTNRMKASIRWELLEEKRRAGPGAVEGDAGEELSWLFGCGGGSGGAGGNEGGEEGEGEGDDFGWEGHG